MGLRNDLSSIGGTSTYLGGVIVPATIALFFVVARSLPLLETAGLGWVYGTICVDCRATRAAQVAGSNRGDEPPVSTRWDGHTSYNFTVPKPQDRRRMPETWKKAGR